MVMLRPAPALSGSPDPDSRLDQDEQLLFIEFFAK